MKEQIAVYELLRDMIRGKTGHLSRVTYTPQKPAFSCQEEAEQSFPRTPPETQGISSRRMSEFFLELAALKETDIHHVMALRNGAVIGECSFAPYQQDIWHIGHSMCKSITGMAIGLLIEEGRLRLDDRVVKIMERRRGLLTGMRQKGLTIEHLLTMQSGVDFRETGIVMGDDWVKGYLDSSVSSSPGTRFDYNSMNSYMLSAIVTEITGKPMSEYLEERLFGPMGIRNYFWETCPKGITKGGWGLFLRPEDAAKLGQLYLDKGRFKGKQLISQEWVAASTSKKVDTPQEMNSYGYGYQLWIGGREGSFIFNGMLGQNVAVYPDLNMVIVTNAGSNELFPNCKLMDVVHRYFEGDFSPPQSLPERPLAYGEFQRLQKQLGISSPPFPARMTGGWKRKGRERKPTRLRPEMEMKKLSGRLYTLERQQAGLFPLIMQVFHNNFTDGISSLGFLYAQGKSYLLVKEGPYSKKLKLGFGRGAINEISIHGEPYLCAVQGEFTRNEDGVLALKVDIAFLEEAARRKLKIFFREEEIQVYFQETPGKELIQKGLGGVLKEAANHPLLNGIRELSAVDLPELLVEQTISPVIRGTLSEEKHKEEEK